MFHLSAPYNGFKKLTWDNSPLILDVVDTFCLTDIFQLEGKHYFRLKPHGSLVDYITRIDDFCDSQCQNYSRIISSDGILVKIPYRYKKYEVLYEDGANSGNIKSGNIINCSLAVLGVFSTQNITTCAFKLTSITGYPRTSIQA